MVHAPRRKDDRPVEGCRHHDAWTILTLGRRWIDQQWLAQLFFYGLWRAGGWGLALLVVLVLYLAAFVVAAVVARRLGAPDRAVAAVVVSAYFTGITNSDLRAQVPAYLLFALVLALLVTDARRPSRRVLWVLPLVVVWANVHGSVVIGASLIALRGLTCAAGGMRSRLPARAWLTRSVALIVLPWPCTLLSPYGLGLVHYYRSTLGNSELARASAEWGATSVRTDPLFFALVLIAAWLIARSGSATTWFDRLALAFMALAGLYAVRYTVWLALAAAPILPLALAGAWRETGAPRRAGLNLALAGVAVSAAALSAVVGTLHGNAWFERDYPAPAAAAAAAAAQADPALRILANEKYADWLLLEHPVLEGRVAYDVRFELLTSAQLASLIDFRKNIGLEWKQAARGYRLLVLDPRSDGQTIAYYRTRPGTTVLFESGAVVVLRL